MLCKAQCFLCIDHRVWNIRLSSWSLILKWSSVSCRLACVGPQHVRVVFCSSLWFKGVGMSPNISVSFVPSDTVSRQLTGWRSCFIAFVVLTAAIPWISGFNCWKLLNPKFKAANKRCRAASNRRSGPDTVGGGSPGCQESAGTFFQRTRAICGFTVRSSGSEQADKHA